MAFKIEEQMKEEDPVSIICSCTQSSKDVLIDHFRSVIEKLYQYDFFKLMLDLAATNCRAGRLKFKLKPHENFELDAGNCKTFEEISFDSIINKLSRKRNYVITIKKISSDVVVHEIGHMLEKEAFVTLDADFRSIIASDVNGIKSSNPSFVSAVKSILVVQVGNYPESQRDSELFTRYFELIAHAKEVAGLSSEFAYPIAEIAHNFQNSTKWMRDKVYNKLSLDVDADIANYTKKYIKNLEDIKHSWTQEKIKPLHSTEKTSENQKSKWSSSIKSIKE